MLLRPLATQALISLNDMYNKLAAAGRPAQHGESGVRARFGSCPACADATVNWCDTDHACSVALACNGVNVLAPRPHFLLIAEAEFRAYHLLSLMGQHGKFKGDQQAFLSMLQVCPRL